MRGARQWSHGLATVGHSSQQTHTASRLISSAATPYHSPNGINPPTTHAPSSPPPSAAKRESVSASCFFLSFFFFLNTASSSCCSSCGCS